MDLSLDREESVMKGEQKKTANEVGTGAIKTGELCCGTMLSYTVKIRHLYWFNKTLIAQ